MLRSILLNSQSNISQRNWRIQSTLQRIKYQAMQCIAKYWFAEWDIRIMLALHNFLHKIFTLLYLLKHWHNTHNIHIQRTISGAYTINLSQQTYAHKYYGVSAANRLQFIFGIFTALSPIHNHQNILYINVSIECKCLYTQQIICARI